MRPLELALSAANILAFIALLLPARLLSPWLRLTALLPLLMAATQTLVEGPRWQMFPTYALALIFLIVWLPGAIAPARSPHPAGFIFAALGVLGALVLLVSLALPLILPVFSFPPPTGPYAIGTVTYHWIDAQRHDAFSSDPAAPREIIVQLWYPAAPGSSGPRAAWVDDPRVFSFATQALHLPDFLFDHVGYVRTNAMRAVPLADAAASYPVLLFSHGRGGFRNHNTMQVEDLVSRGYVVATIDHPGAAGGVLFPDGRFVPLDARMFDPQHVGHPPFLDAILPFLGQDVSFAIDQLTALNDSDPDGRFTHRLDLQHLGAFGVSLGGAIVVESCSQDPRIKACMSMDVFVPAPVRSTGLQQPAFIMSRERKWMELEHWHEEDIRETVDSQAAFFKGTPGDVYFTRVEGMFHNNFSDAALLSPLGPQMGFVGPIDWHRARLLMDEYALQFFDRYLKGTPAPLLDGPSAAFPEVAIDSRTR